MLCIFSRFTFSNLGKNRRVEIKRNMKIYQKQESDFVEVEMNTKMFWTTFIVEMVSTTLVVIAIGIGCALILPQVFFYSVADIQSHYSIQVKCTDKVFCEKYDSIKINETP